MISLAERFLLFALLGALVLGHTAALAQPLTLEWTPREDVNASTPPSITLYEASDPAVPIKAWYVRADLSDTTWAFRALLSDASGGLEPVGSFAAKHDAFVAINGGYFDGSTGTSYSLVIDEGRLRSANIGALNRSGTIYYPTRSAFGLLPERVPDVAWVYQVSGTTYAYPEPSPNRQGDPQPQPSATFPAGGAPWPARDAMGGGPVLVENGEVRVTWEEEVFFGSGIGLPTDRHPRTAIGYTEEGDLLLLVVDGRQGASRGASLIELAEIMISLGAVEAMNLDGGGSSTMVADGTLINRPEGGTFQRSVASAIVLAPRREAPPDEAIYFDNGDACCYREVGPWFSSANTPYWGDSPSRLVATGDGSHRATFVLDHERVAPGVYEVSAWWVPSFNRATNTPYTVYHGGEGQTVRVNQALASTMNQWNVLGTFTLARGDSVVVSNDAVGTTSPAYVTADAIRLVSTGDVATEAPVPAPTGHVAVYPNPTRGAVRIEATTDKPGPWRAVVVDLLGREVARFEGHAPGGHQTFAEDLSALSPGLYVIRFALPDGLVARSIVVTH
jgi:hypothetical protein